VAPDIPLRDVIYGVLPFVALMALAIVLICLMPGIATWFPNALMGPPGR
jgi:TRAP-type C4-dicarboxylate transport system permease large subunit